jgi:hypothetical protein
LELAVNRPRTRLSLLSNTPISFLAISTGIRFSTGIQISPRLWHRNALFRDFRFSALLAFKWLFFLD